ncbi:unnamed protein product [Protopolystoma xenopodis]|uniref:Uncharacterized protein n=1 Tax=Protopolystoma xenopodis TaxID=117903 RepID=A0A448XJG8_9PLAT|nr:unnamed protein product [Protopolystoma xenopodis]
MACNDLVPLANVVVVGVDPAPVMVEELASESRPVDNETEPELSDSFGKAKAATFKASFVVVLATAEPPANSLEAVVEIEPTPMELLVGQLQRTASF